MALLGKCIDSASYKDKHCIIHSLHSMRHCTLVLRQSALLSYKGKYATSLHSDLSSDKLQDDYFLVDSKHFVFWSGVVAYEELCSAMCYAI